MGSRQAQGRVSGSATPTVMNGVSPSSSPRLTETLEMAVDDLQGLEAMLSNIEYRLGLSAGPEVSSKDANSTLSLPEIAYGIQQRTNDLLRRINIIQATL